MKPIFSDDPKALDKLQAKLEQLQRYHEEMKRINAGYKQHGKEWLMQQVTPETYRFYGRQIEEGRSRGKFYPAWALSNNSATIRATKKRIEALTIRKV